VARNRHISIALAVACAVAALGLAGHGLSARAQGTASATEWEYARLVISDGKAVLVEADAKTTLVPPRNDLSGNRTREPASADQYTGDALAVRDLQVGALNFAGLRGWEAVAAVPETGGLTILLKRPR